MNPTKLLMSLLGKNPTGGGLLGSLLKGSLGGGGGSASGSSGLVGSLVKSALGGGGRSSGGSLLGGLLGGGGGAGGLLSGLLGGGKKQSSGGGGLGGMFGLMSGGAEEPAPADTPSEDEQATLLIRAMCNAAKADGQIDASEQQAIVGRLGDEVDQAEADFLRQELSSPLDVDAFAATIPPAMAVDVYSMSLMAIKVDTPQEAQYLTELSRGLGIDDQTRNAIHQQLGLA